MESLLSISCLNVHKPISLSSAVVTSSGCAQLEDSKVSSFGSVKAFICLDKAPLTWENEGVVEQMESVGAFWVQT